MSDSEDKVELCECDTPTRTRTYVKDNGNKCPNCGKLLVPQENEYAEIPDMTPLEEIGENGDDEVQGDNTGQEQAQPPGTQPPGAQPPGTQSPGTQPPGT